MERSIRDFVSLMLFLVVVALWLNPAVKDANSDLLLETMVAKTPPQAANASSGGGRANAPPTGSAPGTTIAPARRYRPSAASNGTVAGSMTAALQAWFAGARCGGVPLPGATRSERNVAPLWLDDAAPTAGERLLADDSALGALPRSAPSDFSSYLRRVSKTTPLRVAAGPRAATPRRGRGAWLALRPRVPRRHRRPSDLLACLHRRKGHRRVFCAVRGARAAAGG